MLFVFIKAHRCPTRFSCSCRLSVTRLRCHTWSRNRYPFLRTWVPPVLVGYTFSFLCTVLSFCLFSLLAIVSSVIRFTASGYPFGIFKLLIQLKKGPDLKHLNNLKCCHPKDWGKWTRPRHKSFVHVHAVSQRVQINFMFNDNARILCLSKRSRQLQNCLKIDEKSVVLIVCNGIICDISTYTVTVSFCRSTWIRYQKLFMRAHDLITLKFIWPPLLVLKSHNCRIKL